MFRCFLIRCAVSCRDGTQPQPSLTRSTASRGWRLRVRWGYTPENPPATDYFFQYSWILPEIFNSEVHRRRHHYFGTPIRDRAKPLLNSRDGPSCGRSRFRKSSMARPWTGWNTSARSSTKADRAPVRSDCTIESCCTRGREAFARGTADTVRQATHECR